MKKNDKKDVMIMFLLIAILILSVGYTLLSIQFRNMADGKTEKWNVGFNSIGNISIDGTGLDINNNIENNSVATFEVILRDTNDKVKYNVNVRNSGTIDAKIGSIMLVPDNNYVKFSLENVNAEDVIKSGESKNFSLIATYNAENTDNSVLPVHCKLNLILDIVQK